mmetsp:Transcript_15400/g.23213  ORF Transcript_15400/g.23213 Transcript_15400/m.23213 type:complete len:848 (-) Transcript_15400:170-2713(-)
MQGDWNALGEVLYRKWQTYDMQWGSDMHIEDFQMCGAPFGGPLAMIRDEKKFVALSGETAKSKLRIFTSAGRKLAEIDWNDRRVVGMGWSDHEQLVIVLEDGNALIYDIHGKLVRNFLILEAVTSVHILECHFWGNGVVAISSDMQLFVFEGLSTVDGELGSRKYTLRSGLTAQNPFTSMAIVPPLLSRSGLLEVMLGTSDNSIIVADENDAEDQLLQDRIAAPITKISVAPNGRFLACFRRDGVLTVLSVTFTTKVLDFDTKSMSRPMEVTWCGEDAVVLLWKNTGIVMVGPYGDWLNYPYDGAVALVSEQDCCRIITSSSCEMLQRVPACTEAIRRIGSTDPAALLYDAMEGFIEGDPKSDENIRSIASTNQLQYAVKSCINAAAAEFDISRQQALLRAASYGKAFCQNLDPEEFVETAKKLRVLNDVRSPDIGLPLTIQEYARLTPEVLVNRLTVRNHHFLALKICELMKLKNESVLVHWASEKVKKLTATSATDEEISQTIKHKLQPFDRVSYLEVAASAYHMGRRRLATMLLDMEQHASDQVPLLLSMQEEELALQKAINSEETDLIYLTLIHLERSRPDAQAFLRLVQTHPEASNLLKIYYRNKVTLTDRSLLHNLLVFNHNYLEAGAACMSQAYVQSAFPKRLQLVKEAVQLFGQNRDLSVYRSMTEEQMELMEIQKALEVRSGRDFLDLSLSETLYNIFLLSVENPSESQRWNQESAKIIKKFKVSEKMVWSLKVQCYSRTGQWEYLSRLAAEKKSPIGYKPFAVACKKNNQPESEIDKYVERISSMEERFDVYVELSMWKRAVDVAYRMKDLPRMQEIMRICRDPQLERQIADMIAKT